MADVTSDASSESTHSGEKSREELVAESKAVFDLIMRVRMHGPFKMEKKICEYLGFEVGTLHVKTLEDIGKSCKNGDTSRGATYVDNSGFLMGSALYRTETGHYFSGYKFLCKA